MDEIVDKSGIPFVAQAILRKLQQARDVTSRTGATVLALRGELGAGKTTLTQFIARELGISDSITSPTFILMKSYPVSSDVYPWTHLHHIDAYRLHSEDTQQALSLNELFETPSLIVIEWPENILPLLPPRYAELAIGDSPDEPHRRRYQFFWRDSAAPVAVV